MLKYLIISLFVLTTSHIAYAEPKDVHGQGKKENIGRKNSKFANKNKRDKDIIKNKNLMPKFSSKERNIITNYFNNNPFLTSSLPPGIAMNVARGKPLPPGIAKKYLPNNLLNLLPNYPGYNYLAVGRDVVLVDSTTKVVADVLENVLQR